MWPLYTTEALAPMIVALAHIQVALAPICIYRICGPCTWPLHLFSWPLLWPLHLENVHFRPSKRYPLSMLESLNGLRIQSCVCLELVIASLSK